jgi:hypothetical protein
MNDWDYLQSSGSPFRYVRASLGTPDASRPIPRWKLWLVLIYFAMVVGAAMI